MYVKSIELKNYRNHENRQINFGSGFNVITGKNAVGKTNIVEAIFLCCIAKSPMADLDKELVLFGEESGKIKLTLMRREGESEIEIELFRRGKKKITIDGVTVQRMGELLGVLNAVFFSPDEIKVVKQSPSERRRFMDIDLSQSDKSYFYALSRYNKILTQRNNLLKEKYDKTAFLEMLPIWDKQLVEEGAYIIEKRRQFLQELSPLAQEAHQHLSNGEENIELKYISQIDHEGKGREQIMADFSEMLKENNDRDIKYGNTFVGVHKDDIKIIVNGIDVRTYGSRGQQRTATLSLKLAETEHLYNLSGERPVLILDDVFSELDENRRQKLLSDIKTQTIVTATEFEEEINNVEVIRI